ncbi:protein Exd1 homolog [Drosophila busckii]|uniref:protein Exd1 homolog n=1 Tax=Drosophila busckii TaxID=30019 RepID=UPI0014329982|nr:protein Exd1 homolog [Drosophila busckii]
MDGNDDNRSEDSFSTAPDRDNTINSSPLLPHERLSLEQKLRRIILIQQNDKSYHQALCDIRDQVSISVLLEPSFYGRHSKTSVLSSISHRLCDQLYFEHRLKVNGICDTFVEFSLARRDRTLCSLVEAISLVLEIDISELNINSKCESQRNFTGRPLTKDQMVHLGKIAILQGKLHDRLIYDNICKDIQHMSSKLSSKFKNEENSGTVVLNMAPNSKSGFDAIDPYFKVTTAIVNWH